MYAIEATSMKPASGTATAAVSRAPVQLTAGAATSHVSAAQYAQRANARREASLRGDSAAEPELAVVPSSNRRGLHYEDTEAIWKYVNMNWSGTLKEFAQNPEKCVWKAVLSDEIKETHRDDNLILVQAELLWTQNTGSVPLCVTVEGMPINHEEINGSGVHSHFTVEPFTQSPTPTEQALYAHSRHYRMCTDVIKQWENVTKESIDDSIIEKQDEMWILRNDSPIINAVFSLAEQYHLTEQTIAQTQYETFLHRNIAEEVYDMICQTIASIPFTRLSGLKARIVRADGKSFDDPSNLGDDSAASDFQVKSALESRIYVSAKIKQLFVVWKKQLNSDVV